MNNGVFSDFELDLLHIKADGSGKGFDSDIKCVGSMEEEMETRVITKSCRGIVAKKIVRGTGNGTLKITAHVPWVAYTELYGMTLGTLITGVKAYGRNSVHSEFVLTAHVTDEDGAEKYKAYPKCVLEKGVARKIENGAEEVAELELEVSAMPDEYGNGMYEALAEELDETVAAKWMEEFTPEIVQGVTNA